MGLRRRQLPIIELRRLVHMALLFLCTALVAACSGEATPPRNLLLGPEDFPGQAVTETGRENGETSQDEPAVQVELSAPNFILLESLVLFEAENAAMTILSGIKQDQIAQGVTPLPVEGFEDNTGVIDDHLRGHDASTLFFVQGRALVRITLTGAGRTQMIWEIAALAREKSRKQ